MVFAAQFDKFEIKGIQVAAIDVGRARDLIGEMAASGATGYVTVTGAHGIVESVYDEHVASAHKSAAIVVADGMPLVWLGRLLGLSTIGRVNGPELMEYIFAEQKYRQLGHFFYGGDPRSVENLKQAIVRRFGDFNVIGVHCPPIRPAGFIEDRDVIDKIRAARPHFIWVGLSTPKQELWMQTHAPLIGEGVAIGVGAAYDLLSGTKQRAPRWIQRSGFEWLFRLAVEPRRLFYRYVFVIPRFMCFFTEALIKPKRIRCA
jgi:N-acetylglucosaminyldiphosphoundecaprenol N-acetyl-beta-D-mannosaminyltransferase